MAGGSDSECSALKTSCMISSSSLNNNICSESNANSEETVLSEYNALQLAWAGDAIRERKSETDGRMEFSWRR